MTLRIVVADDHALFRDGIIGLLKAAGMDVVGEATNGLEAIQAAKRLLPDVVLMDLAMPEMDGIEATERLKEELPDVKVVMLTVSEEDDDLKRAFQVGARGYLLKSLDSDEFISLLEGLQRGDIPLPRQLTAKLIDQLTAPPADPPPDNEATEREIELLQLVAQGLTNKAMAQELDISENTVKYHLKNIFQKFDFKSRAEAAAYAVQQGLLDEDGG